MLRPRLFHCWLVLTQLAFCPSPFQVAPAITARAVQLAALLSSTRWPLIVFTVIASLRSAAALFRQPSAVSCRSFAGPLPEKDRECCYRYPAGDQGRSLCITRSVHPASIGIKLLCDANQRQSTFRCSGDTA